VSERRFGARRRKILESPSFMEEEFRRVSKRGPTRSSGSLAGKRQVEHRRFEKLETDALEGVLLVPEESLAAPVRRLVSATLLTSSVIVLLSPDRGLLLSSTVVRPINALSEAALP